MTRRERWWSLSTPLLVTIFFGGVIVVLLLAWLRAGEALRAMVEAESRFAELTGLAMAATVGAATRRGDDAEIRRTIERANVARNLDWAVYVDADGIVRCATTLTLENQPVDRTPVGEHMPTLRHLQQDHPARVRFDAERGKICSITPVLPDGFDPRPAGAGLGVVAQQFDVGLARERVLRASLRESMIGGGVLLAGCVLLWFLMRRLLLDRIGRVWAFADAFETRADEAPAIDVAGRDEIGLLARRLERMAATIVERTALLRESQQIEVVGRVTAGVAHDFNNLLTVILGNVSLARSRLPEGGNDRELAGLLEEVEGAGRSAATMTKRLLAFGRRAPTHLRVLDPAVVVTETSRLLRRLIPRRHDLRVEFTPTPNVIADRTQLEQVLINLVLNARDALGDSGRITVSCQPADGGNAGQVQISVADDGAGIAAADRDRIFQPFFTTKPVGEGSGLGLATTRAIVEGLGGRIDLTSELGGGTTFHVFLPATTDPVAAAEEPASGGEVEAKGRCVLLCERDDEVRRAVTGILRAHSCEVFGFRTGSDAMRWLRESDLTPEVVVLDVHDPDGGPQFARAVRAAGHDPKFVLLAAFASDVAALDLGSLRDCTLLTKPLDPDDLVLAVNRWPRS